MPRALLTHGLHYTADQRRHVLATLRERQRALAERSCNYWVFEDPAQPGLMIEFLEAGDRETLARAQESLFPNQPQPILLQVEL